jgi:hypothetical protein
MPKKGKGKVRVEYQLKNKALFQAIIIKQKLPIPPLTKPKFCGFPLRNVNQLWRWDTLEDITF